MGQVNFDFEEAWRLKEQWRKRQAELPLLEKFRIVQQMHDRDVLFAKIRGDAKKDKGK